MKYIFPLLLLALAACNYRSENEKSLDQLLSSTLSRQITQRLEANRAGFVKTYTVVHRNGYRLADTELITEMYAIRQRTDSLLQNVSGYTAGSGKLLWGQLLQEIQEHGRLLDSLTPEKPINAVPGLVHLRKSTSDQINPSILSLAILQMEGEYIGWKMGEVGGRSFFEFPKARLFPDQNVIPTGTVDLRAKVSLMKGTRILFMVWKLITSRLTLIRSKLNPNFPFRQEASRSKPLYRKGM